MQGKDLRYIQTELLNGNLTMQQLVKYYLSQIEKNSHLNAYSEIFREEVMHAAERTDHHIRTYQQLPGPLTGCVISVKDLICIKDQKVSAGSRILDGFRSVYHATAIQYMLDAGATIIGRTNCDEFGMGSASTHCIHGAVRNAADPDRIAGGSSGGAAVAVQMDSCLVAVGTDTGGSVRQPASMCGVYGFKPTYGLVSRYGLIAYASSFDQIGLLAHNPEDLHRVMEIISSADPMDATMYRNRLYADSPDQEDTFAGSPEKIAVFKELLNSDNMDTAIAQTFRQNIQRIQSQGHDVEEISFPWLDYLVPCYYILTTAEASSNLSRYDGVRYGYRTAQYQSLEEMYVKSRTEGFGHEVKKRIMLGTFVLSEAYYDAYYTKAQKVRRLIHDFMDNLFKDYDFLLLPTVTQTAWEIQNPPSDPLKVYMSDIYTVLANLCGLPAISVPEAVNENGLPFGMQWVSGKKKDKKLLRHVMDMQKWHNS
jgi:aspartyl-tRNA(Asn)/glutamyl-tRNA(Gln) amidotransferase subunit A